MAEGLHIFLQKNHQQNWNQWSDHGGGGVSEKANPAQSYDVLVQTRVVRRCDSQAMMDDVIVKSCWLQFTENVDSSASVSQLSGIQKGGLS